MRLRNLLLGTLFYKTFTVWQRLGFHITPNNYYWPIPDTRTLKDDLWSRHSEMVGLDINEAGQLELLESFVSRFKNEYDKIPWDKTDVPYQYYMNNGLFSCVDAEVLYCMTRHFKPRRIIEVGSGYSTRLTAQAILTNTEQEDNYECELIAIEPHPDQILQAGFPGLARLVPRRVQDVPLSEFEKLAENDILFIDSSHVLTIGSDVQYVYLEILPRLDKGVVVHFHDIFLPAEYPKSWVLNSFLFWNEQYLLQAFLTFNKSFEVLWAASYMGLKHPDKLETAFDSYRKWKRGGGSFWIRRTS